MLTLRLIPPNDYTVHDDGRAASSLKSLSASRFL